jgi:hypothetical protein
MESYENFLSVYCCSILHIFTPQQIGQILLRFKILKTIFIVLLVEHIFFTNIIYVLNYKIYLINIIYFII